MARDSKIEWTDHTFNPWWGCAKVSPACDHCYAETWARRVGFDIWGPRGERRFLSDAYWRQPLRWNREAEAAGRRERVFCASMADVFEWDSALTPWRRRLWQLIERTPRLDWLLLTKRPHLANRLTPWGPYWPRNVWLGATVENQRFAGIRVPQLLDAPAQVRFLSCEPLLSRIDLEPWLQSGGIHWVIAGGESGPKARPSDPSWFYGLRDQCGEHATAFHFKQWGEWAPMDTRGDAEPRSIYEDPAFSETLGWFGRHAAGRRLEGEIWDGLPTACPET